MLSLREQVGWVDHKARVDEAKVVVRLLYYSIHEVNIDMMTNLYVHIVYGLLACQRERTISRHRAPHMAKGHVLLESRNNGLPNAKDKIINE